MNINKHGFWSVSNIVYSTKLAAVKAATDLNKPQELYFHFHDRVWMSYNRTNLGRKSLPYLYKERAEQLRDRYDYLVLHYSGGSDSHNILQTFIRNNIKLDEITVRWPKPLIDGKFYKPNNTDFSAKNSPSEWDYAIKPELEKLRVTNPDIKINLVDFTDQFSNSNFNTKVIEDRILNLNMTRGALGSVAMRLSIDAELKLSTAKRKNVGHIFGIEKPMLYIRDNKLYFYFTDTPLDSILMSSATEENRTESFYWAPDYPELTFEQAYQVGLYFKTNPDKIKLLTNDGKTIPEINLDYKIQQIILKNILYKDTWDINKFQVDKPNLDRSDWYYWIHESSELSSLNNAHSYAMRNITDGITDNLLLNSDSAPLLGPVRTRLFYLMDL